MAKQVVEVRGVKIGEGMPKIIIPNVGKTQDEILQTATSYFYKEIKFDLVEWRVDWYDAVKDFNKVRETAEKLRSILGTTPILFTFRTKKEGGNLEITKEEYAELNLKIAATGFVDLIDVEIFTGDDIVNRIIDGAHAHGVKVVASNHDFDKTPAKEEIIARLHKMDDMGADIPKIAVMPQNKEDVLTLLSATLQASEEIAKPITTMSMAGTGAISRMCGEVFGSTCTFGSIGKGSAPGQVNAGDLNKVLNIIHESL